MQGNFIKGEFAVEEIQTQTRKIMFPKMVFIFKIAAEPSFKSLFTQQLCKGVLYRNRHQVKGAGHGHREVSLRIRQ